MKTVACGAYVTFAGFRFGATFGPGFGHSLSRAPGMDSGFHLKRTMVQVLFGMKKKSETYERWLERKAQVSI